MKRPFLIWTAAVAAVVAFGCWGLSRALTLTSAATHVTRGTAIASVTGSVSVSPDAQSEICSPQSGILKESSLKEGQNVHAGDVLASLGPGDIPYKLTEAQTNLEYTKRQLESTLPDEIKLASLQKDLDDATPRKEKGYFALADYAQLQNSVAEQQSIVTQERDKLKTDKLLFENEIANDNDQLERLKIKAPYDGVITTIKAHPGDSLSVGTPVATIISSDLKVRAEINQDDIITVHEDQDADVRFFAYSGRIFRSKVNLLLPSSDKTTQRFTVLIKLRYPPDVLMAGMTGEVAIIEGEHPNALLIPRRALFDGNVVVVNHGIAEVRPVSVGFATLTQAEITKGLNEGELVLTEDPKRFHTGDAVRVTSIVDEKSENKP